MGLQLGLGLGLGLDLGLPSGLGLGLDLGLPSGRPVLAGRVPSSGPFLRKKRPAAPEKSGYQPGGPDSANSGRARHFGSVASP